MKFLCVAVLVRFMLPTGIPTTALTIFYTRPGKAQAKVAHVPGVSDNNPVISGLDIAPLLLKRKPWAPTAGSAQAAL